MQCFSQNPRTKEIISEEKETEHAWTSKKCRPGDIEFDSNMQRPSIWTTALIERQILICGDGIYNQIIGESATKLLRSLFFISWRKLCKPLRYQQDSLFFRIVFGCSSCDLSSFSFAMTDGIMLRKAAPMRAFLCLHTCAPGSPRRSHGWALWRMRGRGLRVLNMMRCLLVCFYCHKDVERGRRRLWRWVVDEA